MTKTIDIDRKLDAIWIKYFTIPWPSLSETERLILIKESRGHKDFVKVSKYLPTNKLSNDKDNVTISRKSLQEIADILDDVVIRMDKAVGSICGPLAALKYLTSNEPVKDKR